MGSDYYLIIIVDSYENFEHFEALDIYDISLLLELILFSLWMDPSSEESYNSFSSSMGLFVLKLGLLN